MKKKNLGFTKATLPIKKKLGGLEFHIGKGLQDIKDIYWRGVSFTLGDENRINFREDKWSGIENLNYSFSGVYVMNTERDNAVKEYFRR